MLRSRNASLKARVRVEEYDSGEVRSRSDSLQNSLEVLAPIFEGLLDDLYLRRTLDGAYRGCSSKVPNDGLWKVELVTVDFEPSPFARAKVEDLENMLRAVATDEFQQDAPFDQVSVVAVPLIAHTNSGAALPQ